jgi:two-component system osmolarity sensor histidine kinase EnvZ
MHRPLWTPPTQPPLKPPRHRWKCARGAAFSLFWRTFFFLSLLLFGSIVAWLQTFRALESEPRAIQSAQQLASLVNLSRAALRYSDSIARVSLIKTLADEERVRITPREPKDKYELFESDDFGERTAEELKARLGSGTVVASSVNGQKGLWVGFAIDGDSYWLLTDPPRSARRATAPG